MPRRARIVCPGAPHHITQRGVRRSDVFRDDADRVLYLKLLTYYADRYRLGLQSYCLMTNHIHLVAVPEQEDTLAKVTRECHGQYAFEFNRKYKLSGHVWQARPFSCVLDEAHAWAAIRYVERNPVRAGIVERAEDYRWSSAPAHCGMASDALLRPIPGADVLIRHWSGWLAGESDPDAENLIRTHTFSGRPMNKRGQSPVIQNE